MEWSEFAAKIKLPGACIAKLETINLTDADYKEIVKMYQQNHDSFFEKVQERADAPLYFLYLYCKMACDTLDKYRKKGLEETVFWETFSDLRIWCDNYYAEHKDYGIRVYDWFWRHLDMTLFRLGRLQFEQMKMRYDVYGEHVKLRKGTKVISIHIPQGEPLSKKECQASIKKAYEMLGKNIPYVCHSWLLFPKLAEMLSPNSNILQFQSLFHIASVDYSGEREAERRIFGSIKKDIHHYEERTILQRNVKKYLLDGNAFGNGWGILKGM